MIGDAPKSVLTGVPGWETEDEQHVLMQYAVGVPEPGQIVEIGAEYGMSSSIFCKGAKPLVRITSIDLFPGDLLQKHNSNLREVGYHERTTKITGDSSLAGKQWTGGPIDLLFIDGDHSYEGAKADLDAWMPHVKVGGFAIVHDCANTANRMPHYMHFAVTRAVSEWFWNTAGAWRLVNCINTAMIFERLE